MTIIILIKKEGKLSKYAHLLLERKKKNMIFGLIFVCFLLNEICLDFITYCMIVALKVLFHIL